MGRETQQKFDASLPFGLQYGLVVLTILCIWNAVTVTTKATEALEMLRKNKESYDIVITDVEMPDMNGFKLLEIIGLEMDMPVISKLKSSSMPSLTTRTSSHLITLKSWKYFSSWIRSDVSKRWHANRDEGHKAWSPGLPDEAGSPGRGQEHLAACPQEKSTWSSHEIRHDKRGERSKSCTL